MMDSHHLGRNRGNAESALQQVQAKALVIGIESDILFPLQEQKYLAQHIPNASLEVITSIYGHDGFLVEFEQIKKIITHYFNKSFSKVLV
jgi:homoserine O-acetyltransferase